MPDGPVGIGFMSGVPDSNPPDTFTKPFPFIVVCTLVRHLKLQICSCLALLSVYTKCRLQGTKCLMNMIKTIIHCWPNSKALMLCMFHFSARLQIATCGHLRLLSYYTKYQ